MSIRLSRRSARRRSDVVAGGRRHNYALLAAFSSFAAKSR
jgi:hypothetical protein